MTNQQQQLPLERLYHWEKTCPDKVYLRQRSQGQTHELNWREVADRSRRMAQYLKDNIEAEASRIAIYANNCADWIIADLAIMMSGHTSVPLYVGQAARTMEYVLNHSDAQLVFVGGGDLSEQVKTMVKPEVKTVAIHGGPESCDTSMADIIQTTEPLSGNPIGDPEHIFTLMYTSGTTGNPKGVMHSFSTVAFAAPGQQGLFNLNPDDRFFSYLPLAHAAERIMVEMNTLYCGASVTFNESLATFVEDLQSCKPTLFFSVPRLWQKFKEKIETKLPPQKMNLLMSLPIIRGTVRKKIRNQLGFDDVRVFITGSAPTPPETHRWFRRLGMVLRDGYGATENFIYGTICQDKDPIIGSVGSVIGEGKVKIADNGEILLKSGALMKGYYLEPEKTAEAFDGDGYYLSGDKGHLNENGHLFITGRIKDTFKTSKGKFIDPAPIEGAFAALDPVEQVCIIGHGLAQPVAVVKPCEAYLDNDQRLQRDLESGLVNVNTSLPSYEKVASMLVVKDEWTAENGLITPTLKLKRDVIEEKYRSAIEGLTPDQPVKLA